MAESSVTIFGNLTKAPDLTDTNGVFRCNFRVASTDSHWDRRVEAYVEAPTVFISVTCWRTLAQNAAQSLGKGDPVMVIGRLRQSSYVNKEGVSTTSIDIDADMVAPDLRKGTTVRVRKLQRQADEDSTFDATGPDDARKVDVEGVPSIDGASIDAELSQLAGDALVGAVAEPPF